MKKLIAMLLVLTMVLSFAACAKQDTVTPTVADVAITTAAADPTPAAETEASAPAPVVTGMSHADYVAADNETEVLKLLPKSRDVLFGRERLVMKKVENSEKVVKTHRPEVPVNSDLLDALKALRKGIASKKSVPAYVIFTDATLIDMCKKCPETPDEMLEVSGVGRTKLEKFGKQFLEEIQITSYTVKG